MYKMVNQEKIIIIRCERFPQESEKKGVIPEGVMCFRQEWYNKTGYRPKYLCYPRHKKSIESILTDQHTIIIPMYQYPLPFCKDIIDKYGKKCKIFAGGPLALLNPLGVKKYTNVDGVLGIEPVYSLLFDNDRILYQDKIPENFYEKKSVFLPKLEKKYLIRDNTIRIIPGSFLKCNRKCSFCLNHTLYKFSKKYKLQDILDRIPSVNKDVTIKLTHYNIFEEMEPNDLRFFIKEIRKKIGIKNIELWIDPRSFVENYRKLLDFNEKIIWNIGLESFSNSQLERYNDLSHKNEYYNNECIKIINNTNDYNINPLLIFFDPWTKPKELIKTIEGYSNIKKSKMSCNMGSIIWKNNIVDNIWFPHVNSILYDKAEKEGLINTNNFNEFGIPYFFERDNYSDWPWKFKHEETRKIYFQILKWINQIKEYKEINIENNISKCSFCPGGFTLKTNVKNGKFMFLKLNNKLVDFLHGKIEAKEITRDINKIKEFTNHHSCLKKSSSL